MSNLFIEDCHGITTEEHEGEVEIDWHFLEGDDDATIHVSVRIQDKKVIIILPEEKVEELRELFNYE